MKSLSVQMGRLADRPCLRETNLTLNLQRQKCKTDSNDSRPCSFFVKFTTLKVNFIPSTLKSS